MLIGGQAVLLHGRPRLTEDIDIALGVDPSHLPVVREACDVMGVDRTPLRCAHGDRLFIQIAWTARVLREGCKTGPAPSVHAFGVQDWSSIGLTIATPFCINRTRLRDSGRQGTLNGDNRHP